MNSRSDPKSLTSYNKSAVLGAFAEASKAAQQSTAEQQSSAAHGVLSPRASLDLTLHPDNAEVCIVRISADPARAHFPDSLPDDMLIVDPTAVAVLEHAFQPNTTHPVFHVHMPSRRSSQHGHAAASEADSEGHLTHDHHLHQSGSGHVHDALDHDHLQPLLHGAQHQQHGHGHGHHAEGPELGLWQRWQRLLQNPEAVPFFAMSLLMGFGTGILSVYLFLYLDELGET